jgi:prepilin signal peptidase PulO-like enzyme (type II secretory pathway)
MLALFFFVLGACIGSFLNVVIYRYNTGMSINGRSQCFNCSRILQWFDLIPIISFLAYRGKCRSCKSKISWQYPLVELATAFLFLALFLFNGLSSALFFDLIIFSLLIVMTVYDIRHKIIPDGLVLFFVIFGLLKMLLPLFYGGEVMWIDVLSGFIFYVPFYLLWKISDGKWIGLGDGKLAIGIGAFLGFASGFTAIVFGFWLGAIFGIFYISLQKLGESKRFSRSKLGLFFNRNSLTMKSELPLAPFLILGVLIAFFSGFNLLLISSFI